MNLLTDLTSPDSLSLTIDQKDKFDFEGEENPRPRKFIEIMNKKEHKRLPTDLEYLTMGLFKLNVFCKPLIPHLLHWKGVIEKIIPYLDLEFFPAGTPIIHYGNHMPKLYILCNGEAKEFVAKSAHQMLKESQANALKLQTVINLVNTDYYAAPSPLVNSPAKKLGKLVAVQARKDGRSPFRPKDKEVSFDIGNMSFKKTPSLGSMPKTNSDQQPRSKLLKESRSLKVAQEIPEYSNEKGVTRQIWETFKANAENYFSEEILKVKVSRVFSEGSSFGMTSLDDSKLKTCAVVASEDSYCLSLKQENLKRIVDQEVALHAFKIEFFCDLFPEINKYKLVEFALPWEEQVLQVNDVIFQQGEDSEYLYVIMSGEVVLSRGVKNVDKEKALHEEPGSAAKKKNAQDFNFKIAKVCDGNFFGEEDFFRSVSREMTAAVCSPRARILRLNKLSCDSFSERLQEIIYHIRERTVSKAIWNRKRLQDLYVQNVPLKETAADSYIDLKGNIFNVLCQKEKNANLNSGVVPKIKQFTPLKKAPLLKSYDIVSELHQKHPKLMNFITQQQMKFSRPKEKSMELLPKMVSSPLVLEKTVDLDISRSEDWLPFTRSRRPQATAPPEKSEETQRWASSKSIAIASQFDELEASKVSIVKDLSLSKDHSKDLLFQSQISASAGKGFPGLSKSTSQMIQARKARTLGSSFKNRSQEVRKYLKRTKDSPSREGDTVLVESSEIMKNFDPILITAIDYESKKAGKDAQPYSPHLNLSKGTVLGYSIIDNFSGNSRSNKKGLSELITPASVGSFGGLTSKSFKITGRKNMSPLQRSVLKDSQDKILI